MFILLCNQGKAKFNVMITDICERSITWNKYLELSTINSDQMRIIPVLK